jgi:hypothetical protein
MDARSMEPLYATATTTRREKALDIRNAILSEEAPELYI